MGLFYKQKLDDIYGVKSDRPAYQRIPDFNQEHYGNKRYHNYFRGYTEMRVVRPNGSIKIERVYTSPWQVAAISDRTRVLIKIAYFLLFAVCAFLYVFAMTRDVPGNKHWIVGITGLPVVAFLIFMFTRTIIYITHPRRMTYWDIISGPKRLRQTAGLTALIVAVTGVVLIVFALVTNEEVGRTIGCGLMDIGAAVCAAAVWFIERRVPYTEEENENAASTSGEKYNIR